VQRGPSSTGWASSGGLPVPDGFLLRAAEEPGPARRGNEQRRSAGRLCSRGRRERVRHVLEQLASCGHAEMPPLTCDEDVTCQ
jgi:hypothetical protein